MDNHGRWFLGGCFAIFMVPFFIAGITVLRTGIRLLHRGDSNAWMLVGFGLVFTAFSLGFASLIWFSLRQGRATAQRRSAYPAQPWLWRDDWSAQRVAETGSPAGTAGIWIFALMWNAITLPMVIVILTRIQKNAPAAFALLFAAIGVALLAAATYATLRQRKFGRSVCAIDRVPIEPGRTLSGTVEHRGTEVPEGGYRFVLSCINRIVTGSSRSRSVTNDVLWEAEQRVSAAVAAPSPLGMRVPFSFDIPADAPSTETRGPNDSVLWQLAVAAELPGIDYKSTFELPVFATAGDAAVHHAERRDAAALRDLAPQSRVSIAPLPTGGIELRVAPLRSAGAFATFLVIATIWFGAIALMWRLGAPQFIAVVFSLFGLLILALAVDFFAGTSIVSADRRGVQARRVVFGIPKSTSLDVAQVESIEPKVAGHVGNHPYYDVEARLPGGASRTLARYLESRSDAETVAAKLWAALRG